MIVKCIEPYGELKRNRVYKIIKELPDYYLFGPEVDRDAVILSENDIIWCKSRFKSLGTNIKILIILYGEIK